MSDILSQSEAALELARTWESDAEAIAKYDPDDPKKRVLEQCASDLRSLADSTHPEWVPLAAVQRRTGWSKSHLWQRCRALEREGLARQSEGGKWEVRWDAAIRVPVKNAHEIEDTGDLLGMARDLVAQAGG